MPPIELNYALFPTIKRFLIKSLFFYIPLYFIFSIFEEPLAFFFLFISIVLFETIDAYQEGILIQWCKKIIKFLLDNATTIFSIFGIFLGIFILFIKPSFHEKVLEIYLTFLGTIISFLIPLFFTLLQQVSKDFSVSVAKEMSNIKGLKPFFFYIFIIFASHFYLFFSATSDQNINGDFQCFLFLEIMITLCSLGFVIKTGKDIISLEKGVIQAYSEGVIKYIKKVTPIKIINIDYDNMGIPKDPFYQGRFKKIIISGYSWISLYITGKIESFTGQIPQNELPIIEGKIRVLFRLTQKFLEKDEAVGVEICCKELTKIMKVWIERAVNIPSYLESDNLSHFLIQESNILFQIALQKENEESLEYIAIMIGEVAYTSAKIPKNALSSLDNLFFTALKNYFILSLDKERSLTPNKILSYLHNIGILFGERGDALKCSSIINIYQDIGVSTSERCEEYFYRLDKRILWNIWAMFFSFLNKNPNSLRDHNISQTLNVTTNLIQNIYKHEPCNIEIGTFPAEIFFDHTKITNIFHFLSLHFQSFSSIAFEKQHFLLYFIKELLRNILILIEASAKHKKDTDIYGIFCFKVFELLFSHWEEIEKNAKLLGKGNEIFRVLEQFYEKNYEIFILGRYYRDIFYAFATIILEIIFCANNYQSKRLFSLVENVVRKNLEMFNKIDEEDYNKNYFYKYFLLTGTWLWKFYPEENITKEMIEFLKNNKNLEDFDRHISDNNYDWFLKDKNVISVNSEFLLEVKKDDYRTFFEIVK
ncbi:MAG: hypothetical protein WCJ84_01060 [Candidatus Peregrinibacteria bacterium]